MGKKLGEKALMQHYEPAIKLPEAFRSLFQRLDNETKCHSIRCAKYLLELGFMRQDQIDAALLHDLGKQFVPIQILTKKGELTQDEWAIIKQHPVKGRDMIMTLPMPEGLKQYSMDMAMFHHERFNGSGYPFGLKGEEIPYCARVMAIVDTFDAMTSRRCYQKKSSKAESLDFIKRQAGILYDPDLVAKIKPKQLIVLD